MVTKAEIDSGVCGFKTQVMAERGDQYRVRLEVESECPDIQKLAEELKEVNAFEEISFRKGVPFILELGQKHCSHAACPVPSGIIKAVEVEAGLALPKAVTIRITKE